MIVQKDKESRLEYLSRVLEAYMQNYGYDTIDYDEATCDGLCLAEDIKGEIDSLIHEAEATKKMKIALDYDETYTADPNFWFAFVKLAKLNGHTVTFVTYRYELNEGASLNEDIKKVAKSLDIDVVFTNGKQKAGLFNADIWIDDEPVTIPTSSELYHMHVGFGKLYANQ